MTHDRVRRRLSRYLEGDLSARQHARVERHLADCATCAEEPLASRLCATRFPGHRSVRCSARRGCEAGHPAAVNSFTHPGRPARIPRNSIILAAHPVRTR